MRLVENAVALREEERVTGLPIGTDSSSESATTGPSVLLQPLAVLRELEHETATTPPVQRVSLTHLDCVVGSVIERDSVEGRTPISLAEWCMNVAYVGSGLAGVD